LLFSKQKTACFFFSEWCEYDFSPILHSCTNSWKEEYFVLIPSFQLPLTTLIWQLADYICYNLLFFYNCSFDSLSTCFLCPGISACIGSNEPT
jgi:hypothetical protein